MENLNLNNKKEKKNSYIATPNKNQIKSAKSADLSKQKKSDLGKSGKTEKTTKNPIQENSPNEGADLSNRLTRNVSLSEDDEVSEAVLLEDPVEEIDENMLKTTQNKNYHASGAITTSVEYFNLGENDQPEDDIDNVSLSSSEHDSEENRNNFNNNSLNQNTNDLQENFNTQFIKIHKSDIKYNIPNNPITVILCVDSSEFSNSAFNWYLDHLHKPKNVVILFHVLEKNVINSDILSQKGIMKGKDLANYQASINKQAEASKEMMNNFKERLKSMGATHKLVYKEGLDNIGAEVIKQIESHKAKMVVIGTRGLGTVRRTILGSVSDFLVHNSPCSVAICPPRLKPKNFSHKGKTFSVFGKTKR